MSFVKDFFNTLYQNLPPLNQTIYNSAFGKQALAHAERDRADVQPQLVNQVVLQQRLEEDSAAVDSYSGPSCCLSLVISWTTSPWRSVELLQSSVWSVVEATYFLA